MDNLPQKISGQQTTDSFANEFRKQLETAVKDLYFISETDAEISIFSGKKAQTINKAEILIQTENPENAPVEEKNFAEFFVRLTEIQDWFSEEEKATARKFAELKDLLEKNLRALKVFKIGTIQLDIYVVGLDAENNLSGIKTKAVET